MNLAQRIKHMYYLPVENMFQEMLSLKVLIKSASFCKVLDYSEVAIKLRSVDMEINNLKKCYLEKGTLVRKQDDKERGSGLTEVVRTKPFSDSDSGKPMGGGYRDVYPSIFCYTFFKGHTCID
jgi:hypothetical protein